MNCLVEILFYIIIIKRNDQKLLYYMQGRNLDRDFSAAEK